LDKHTLPEDVMELQWQAKYNICKPLHPACVHFIQFLFPYCVITWFM